MTGRTLVAGVGNVFLRDDAFGCEVVRLLAEHPVPDGVQIRDFGIRGVHLSMTCWTAATCSSWWTRRPAANRRARSPSLRSRCRSPTRRPARSWTRTA